ncbi:hypothetical protein HMPREF1267_00025 [Corynebacterium sp. KPL1824]|uniref:UvrD-helicase domain-containing protein n=1 Tax=Corynebacterium sp. KPL1824 TaxID=1203561 RepID=UPI0003B8FBCB|nr:UvrD-helicase domain-containing protein [Corynebacterium sp. KPL1824]ERS54725.1 hypothetical protein HMPREF1267_00025 [Corynebacterium sp. KPL1824]
MSKIELTPEQQAIIDTDQPFFIDADPGSGKTFIISEHIKRMLSSAGGKPFLLLTFTNTAVNSFQAKLTSYETFDIEANRRLTQSRVLTFDSFINAYLARPLASYLWPDIKYRFVPSFERIPNSRIPTPSNGKSTVNIQHFEPDGTYKGNKKSFKRWAEDPGFSNALANAYHQKFCEGAWSSKLIRFKLKEILTGNIESSDAAKAEELTKQLLKLIALRFPSIYIDEAQDCNRFEWCLVDELRRNNADVFIIGDKKQAIYGFRDISAPAPVFAPLASQKSFVLRRSFRSNNAICDFANKFQKMGLHSKISPLEFPSSSSAVSIFTYSNPAEYIQKLNSLDGSRNIIRDGWTVLSHRAQTLDDIFGDIPAFGQERDPAHEVYTQLLSLQHASDNVNASQITVLIDSFQRLLPLMCIRPNPKSNEGEYLLAKGEGELSRVLATQAICNTDGLIRELSRIDFEAWLQESVLAKLHLNGVLMGMPDVFVNRYGQEFPSLTKRLWSQPPEKKLGTLDVKYRGTIHSVKGLEFPKVSVVIDSWRPPGEDSLLTKVLKHRDTPGSDETLNVAYVGITRAIHQVNIAFKIDSQNYHENTFREELEMAGLDQYLQST